MRSHIIFVVKRISWIAWWTGILVVIVAWGCLIYAESMTMTIPLPSRFLNTDVFRKHDAESARILVFGDTQKGLAGFAGLAVKAEVKPEDLVFHTGDLVSRADDGHFDLAFLYLGRHIEYSPIVVTPGNHDIKGGDGLFERRIGRRQFSFRWGPVDIVVVDNSTGPPDEAAVEKMLVQSTVPVLLFMHVPPIEAPAADYKPKPAYASFLRMIRKYPVVYVFSGHAHGYSRVEHEGLIFISNGVGGDSESWQFDQKAHLTIVDASRESIKAREISIDPVFSVRANLEHLAIGHVREVLRGWRVIYLVGATLLLIALGWRLRRKRITPPTPPAPGKFTPAKVSEPPDVVI